MTVLLHIGFHKTATSWLQKYLFRNPGSGMRTIGKKAVDNPARALILVRPLDFDADEWRARFEPYLGAVREEGLLPVVSNERLSGHPSSGGFDSKEIADRLGAIFPDGKVLIVIREQRSMIRSVYKQYVVSGGAVSFAKFAAAPYDHDVRMPAFDFRYYEYDRLIAHYRSLFGDDAVLVLPYEQFGQAPREFVARIGDFAGRPLSDDVLRKLRLGRRPHRTPPAYVVSVMRRTNQLARRSRYHPAPVVDSPGLTAQVQRLLRADAVQTVVPRSLVERQETALDRAIAEAVGDRYRESNRRTAQLIGADLDRYGWTV